MYRDICLAPCWDQPICLSSDSRSEVLFWQQNFDNSGYLIWAPSPKVEVLTCSDTSGLGWGGFAIHINGKPTVGSWSEEESGKSSTFRELRAIQYVLELYSEDLCGKEVCHRTDNRNAEFIISVGNRLPDLCKDAVSVCKLCCELNIQLSVEWVSRNDNSTLMSFQEWRMLLTTFWIPSAFVILISYGDLILSTDLPALKLNSWTGIAFNTATLVVRLVMCLQFPGHRITIGIFHLPCLFQRF